MDIKEVESTAKGLKTSTLLRRRWRDRVYWGFGEGYSWDEKPETPEEWADLICKTFAARSDNGDGESGA